MSAGVDRLTRVNALLKREIADYLESGAVILPSGALISVTEVKSSVDLRNAVVFISVFGGGDEAKAEKGSWGVLARDLIDGIQKCMKRAEESMEK